MAQSVQHEALDHFIVVNESQLDHIVSEYLIHYHEERPPQGIVSHLEVYLSR